MAAEESATEDSYSNGIVFKAKQKGKRLHGMMTLLNSGKNLIEMVRTKQYCQIDLVHKSIALIIYKYMH